MPSGYTSRVADGTITSLDKFALLCARGFGALVTMRDEPLDASIPETLQPNTDHHDKQIVKAVETLQAVPAMSDAACDAAAKAEYDEEMVQHNTDLAERRAIKERYAAMLDKVTAWQPQAEIAELRRYMIQQLQKSIEYDCREPDHPVLKTGAEWRSKKIERAQWNLEYHTRQRSEEIERTNERNTWLSSLRESLKDAEPDLDAAPQP